MENTDFSQIADLLTESRRILVTAHTNPDGDAIGSGLALASYLRMKGHKTRVLVPDHFPDFLSWMPGATEILVFKASRDEGIAEIAAADVIVSVDYNQLDRLNEAAQYARKSQAVKVLIDHHLDPSGEFDHMISLTRTSSTAELVYDFVVAMGDIDLIDRAMAECLYAGIITDTGSLSYACNYVKTYLVVAELFRRGIDGEHIHRLIYDTYSENRLRLLGHSISQCLTVLHEYHTAYIVLTREDLQRFDHQIGDTEGIVNYALSIRDINLAALFTERDGIVKVSFRSKGNFSVNTLAASCFNGGGHRNAAGANCSDPIQETVERFLAVLPGYRDQLARVY